ncbi:MAG: FixH family protein, partial [Deltaproteobacteria bacterium]|nr:FixH family protein [Deltaproteobacteria bacterium]
RDANAVAVDDVELTIFHHAAAADRRAVEMVAREPGVYRGPAALSRAGKWRFEVRARRGADVFTHTESRMVGQGEVP